MAGRICLSGDTHGVLDTLKIASFQESNKKLDENDYLIICGDAGIVWEKETIKESIDYFESFGTNILFVDGNHENFDILNSYPVTIWNGGKVHKISDKIFHLMRGQVFKIAGKTFLTLGGADSTDKQSRTKGLNWWKEESFGYDDFEEAYLNLQRYDFKVDYVISHSPNNELLQKVYEQLTCCGESVPYYLQKKLKQTQTSNILQDIKQKLKFKKWFCGHLHIDENIDEYMILYSYLYEI
ncbi:MAG: metallophosphoesterase [Clostridia bacterium]|nr:metallophosphoesterase [Clostridia bacterium]